MNEVDQLLETAQREIAAGLNGTLEDCIARCNHAIELIGAARNLMQ